MKGDKVQWGEPLCCICTHPKTEPCEPSTSKKSQESQFCEPLHHGGRSWSLDQLSRHREETIKTNMLCLTLPSPWLPISFFILVCTMNWTILIAFPLSFKPFKFPLEYSSLLSIFSYNVLFTRLTKTSKPSKYCSEDCSRGGFYFSCSCIRASFLTLIATSSPTLSSTSSQNYCSLKTCILQLRHPCSVIVVVTNHLVTLLICRQL